VFLKKIRDFLILGMMGWTLGLSSEPNLQVLLEGLDRDLKYTQGVTEAKLTKRKGNVLLKEVQVRIFQREEDTLILGYNSIGEERWKVLSKKRGDELYFTLIPSRKLIQFTSLSRLDRIPGFYFSFEDLSNFRREERFLSSEYSEYESQTQKYWKMRAKPLVPEGYSQLAFYFSVEGDRPYRIDFWNPGGSLYKIIRFEYGEVNHFLQNDQREKRNRIRKIKATDTNTSEESSLEITNIRENFIPPKHLFEPKNLSTPEGEP
jgi:hypothetical protein